MSSAYTKKAKLSVLSYQYKPQAYTGWVPSFRNSIYPNPNTGPHAQTRTQTDRQTHRQIVFLYIDKQSNQLIIYTKLTSDETHEFDVKIWNN